MNQFFSLLSLSLSLALLINPFSYEWYIRIVDVKKISHFLRLLFLFIIQTPPRLSVFTFRANIRSVNKSFNQSSMKSSYTQALPCTPLVFKQVQRSFARPVPTKKWFCFSNHQILSFKWTLQTIFSWCDDFFATTILFCYEIFFAWTILNFCTTFVF